MKLLTSLISVSTLLGSFAIGYSEETQFQYDGRSGYALVMAHSFLDSNGSDGFEFVSNTYARHTFSEYLAVQFEHYYRGVNNKGLFPEDYYPYENNAAAGILLTGLGDLNIMYSNTIFPDAHSSPVPYYASGSEMNPQMLNTVDGEWILELDWFHIQAQATAFIYKFKLVPSDPNAFLGDASLQPFGDKRDTDLWLDCAIGFLLPSDISLDGGIFIKDDLTRSDFYDNNLYWLGISGEQQIKPNRLMLSWEMRERFLQSQFVKANNRADGFATNMKARMLMRRNAKLFIKGEVSLGIAEKLCKQYYEFQLRKSINEKSSLDITCFATNGVLFPRQGLNIGSTLYIHDHFGIAPSASLYTTRFPNTTNVRYYRSDYILNLLFPIRQGIEMYTGVNYSNYDRHPYFSSRCLISTGLRTW